MMPIIKIDFQGGFSNQMLSKHSCIWKFVEIPEIELKRKVLKDSSIYLEAFEKKKNRQEIF